MMYDAQESSKALSELLLHNSIRDAKVEDKDLFMELWEEFVSDVRGNGYEIVWTPRTEGFFSYLFDSYLDKTLDGVVILCGNDGALIWGETAKEPAFDTIFGRMAYGFGTYLRNRIRGQGLSRAMRDVATRDLTTMGFDSVFGAARANNKAGYQSSLSFGFEEHSMTGVLKLR
jgi:hypothetical protein